MLFGEFSGALENALAHDFSGLEFHDRTRWDDHLLVGLLRIAADALLGEGGAEHTEFAQFHAAPGRERLGDSIEGELDD